MRHVLNHHQRAMIPIAVFAANDRLAQLNFALHEGLDLGLSINEIKEIMIQLYAYVGFPRSLNALSTLMSVVEGRRQNGVIDDTGKLATPVPENWNSLENGTRNQTQLIGQPVTGALFEFAPAIDQFLKSHLFGDIFQRDILDWQTRELVTLSALAALSGVNSQLRSHYSIAHNTGLSSEQLTAFIEVLYQKCGNDIAANADTILREALPLTHSTDTPQTDHK